MHGSNKSSGGGEAGRRALGLCKIYFSHLFMHTYGPSSHRGSTPPSSAPPPRMLPWEHLGQMHLMEITLGGGYRQCEPREENMKRGQSVFGFNMLLYHDYHIYWSGATGVWGGDDLTSDMMFLYYCSPKKQRCASHLSPPRHRHPEGMKWSFDFSRQRRSGRRPSTNPRLQHQNAPVDDLLLGLADCELPSAATSDCDKVF